MHAHVYMCLYIQVCMCIYIICVCVYLGITRHQTLPKLDQYCDSCESLLAALGTAAGTPSLCIGNEVIGGGALTVGFFAAGAPGWITFCSGVTLLLNR